ncbi:hypothetical protein G7B40_007135 [Aetokthonos hydrillicola Thurmond2011]|jgi:hypothetical protein|uniref:Uncharacterized protein n=1 Tax=Aetokthonos hydrillicola Thurmond2011 TaxID=2712845 RepID=A0AAP5I421_9CYAN|nr:hypothetical protein [Aetokthonos hydrillicola]MBO3459271.1 hypothetical protein [Aetokthonos hydrillicola CCALA 1050]MBW4590581.1 hypothetical protein [Aetokthonos hydrillicola CCALA 1050]MDR9894346.1 hypothetical protein [Aetokthonos hydrillicola Thurmond2011]
MLKKVVHLKILKSLVGVLGVGCLIASFTASPAYSQTYSQNKPKVQSQYRIIPSNGYESVPSARPSTINTAPNARVLNSTGHGIRTVPHSRGLDSRGYYRARPTPSSEIFGSTSEINNIGGDVTYPYGSRVYHNGVVQTPSGQLVPPAVSTDHGNGTKTFYYPDGSRIDTNGSKIPSTGVLIK